MSFASPGVENPQDSLLWNINSLSAGGVMAMEMQDSMRRKGVSKRVLFNPKDSTWTMLLSFNNVKQGSRVHRADMFRDRADSINFKVIYTKQKKAVEGFICKKIIIESSRYISELWITKNLSFDLTFIYKLLNHCGMMGEIVRKGDWYKWNDFKGMILEVKSTKKSNGETYTLRISQIKRGVIDPALFTTTGFRISEIPEGQNCGPIKED